MGVLDPEYLPPVARMAAARRFTFGTISRAVARSAWATPSIMKPFCKSTTIKAVLAGSRVAKVRGSSARDHRVDNSLRDGNFMHRDTLLKWRR